MAGMIGVVTPTHKENRRRRRRVSDFDSHPLHGYGVTAEWARVPDSRTTWQEKVRKVLEERRLERAGPVVPHPVRAEEAVLDDAVATLAEVGDHRSLRGDRAAERDHAATSVSDSIVTTPRGCPAPSRTTSERVPAVIICESASRSVVEPSAVGPAAPSSGGAS